MFVVRLVEVCSHVAVILVTVEQCERGFERSIWALCVVTNKQGACNSMQANVFFWSTGN